MKHRPVAADFRPERIIEILDRHGVRFVVVGGVAARLHGSDQITNDIDLAHDRADDNLVRLVAALRELDARRVTYPDEATEPRAVDFEHRIEQFVCPIGNIDVLAEVRRVGGYERLVDRAESVELRPGLSVLVADIDSLILSKAGTGRPKDPNHIRSLERVKQERARIERDR